jgi:hypothetical protein
MDMETTNAQKTEHRLVNVLCEVGVSCAISMVGMFNVCLASLVSALSPVCEVVVSASFHPTCKIARAYDNSKDRCLEWEPWWTSRQRAVPSGGATVSNEAKN